MIHKYKNRNKKGKPVKKLPADKDSEETKTKTKKGNWKKNSNIQDALKIAYRTSLQVCMIMIMLLYLHRQFLLLFV